MYICFDLSRWIDITTGEIKNGQTDVSREGFLEEVYRQGVDTLLRNHLLRGSDPFVLLNDPGLRIELSEDMIKKPVKVYSGIGAGIPQDPPECWPDTERLPREEYPRDVFPADTREQQQDQKTVLLGQFKPLWGTNKIGKITLYTKAMFEYANRKALGFEEVFWPTLAREVFKAFHYHMFQKEGKADRYRSRIVNNKDRELVKISLAVYFEYCFRTHHPCIINADFMIKEWESFDIDGWPASGALGIQKSAQSDELFRYLFWLSFFDWKTAADIIRTGYYLSDPVIKSKLRA